MYFFDKKAEVDTVMSWLFMIIIGGVFFLLAYTIVDNYKQNEDNKYEIELKQSFRTVFNLAGRTSGVEENKVVFADKLFQGKSVEIKCIAEKPNLFIDDGKIVDTNNDFLENYPTFMTKIYGTKTDDIYLAVESFRMPFKITNLVAITTKKNVIIFDKNSKISKKLIYKFEKGSYSQLNYKSEWSVLEDLGQIVNYAKSNDIYSIVLVSDNSVLSQAQLNQFGKYKDRVYQVQISGDSNFKWGQINITESSGVKETFNYVDYDGSFALVTMALFSNIETYECSYNQVIKSIPQVYDFYSYKSDYLYLISKSNLICSSSIISYDSSEVLIGSVQQDKYKRLNESLVLVKNEVIENKLSSSSILNKLLVLENNFKDLEKYNCPYVY